MLPSLAGWENFYVIVGSSAGALTGLQFVVIALVSETQATGSMREIRAFATPTIVHFCAALLISGILSSPWHVLSSVSIALTVVGGLGVLYALSVVRHARAQTGYAPDLGDWLWYTAFPVLAYAALLVAAVLLPRNADTLMFVIAASTLALLFLGIHNAWDTVTYVAVVHSHRVKKSAD
ncbi:MAG TPA: hypothetical protein VFU27_02950 [Terriglobales bacterium]|nr:hypothetical protein [Terriglobales bacterium]